MAGLAELREILDGIWVTLEQWLIRPFIGPEALTLGGLFRHPQVVYVEHNRDESVKDL
jgi:hypothetical protein